MKAFLCTIFVLLSVPVENNQRGFKSYAKRKASKNK